MVVTSVSTGTQRYMCAIVYRVPGSREGYGRYESAGSGGKKNMSRGNWIHPATNQP